MLVRLLSFTKISELHDNYQKVAVFLKEIVESGVYKDVTEKHRHMDNLNLIGCENIKCVAVFADQDSASATMRRKSGYGTNALAQPFI